jgi:hypothetical protein
VKKLRLNPFRYSVYTIAFFVCLGEIVHSQTNQTCVPGWNGTILIDCESTANWSVEASTGASGTISSIPGFVGSAVQLNWNIGAGDWVQAKYTFPQPVDLSQKDIFGLSLRGSLSDLKDVDIMFADINNVFYGTHFEGINNIQTWMKNLPLPKKLFYWYFQIRPDPTPLSIDWSHINRFFVVVKPSAGVNPLIKTGQLAIDHLQADRAADWFCQQQFEILTTQDTTARNKAVRYIIDQQRATGLCISWKEEPEVKAWLYDQALALIVLTREGIWFNGIPQNESALSAKALADFITSQQKLDGHWPRMWNPDNGTEHVDDLWIGDQAWWIIALTQYARKSQDIVTLTSAQKGANWLALRINENGGLVPSTEGNVDTWWAMLSTKRFIEANKIQSYLLNKVWDSDLQYWWRGLYNDSIPDPVVAMDCATWMSEFAKSPYVQKPEMSKAALSLVRKTLVTTDNSGSRCGFDGMGPVGIWCEGTAQYIMAGGEDAQQFLTMLLSLQRSDGGMPGSPDNLGSSGFGWLSNWTGLSSTAWLYFALTESPFPKDSTTGIEPSTQLIKDFILQQNFPNPMNPSTTINFSIPEESYVTIVVYDILGNEISTVVNEIKQPGRYRILFSTDDLASDFSPKGGCASGVYFYQMRAGPSSGSSNGLTGQVFIETKKMILLR